MEKDLVYMYIIVLHALGNPQGEYFQKIHNRLVPHTPQYTNS